ncbi:hypothetical protein M569_07749 [Genlisea aurea]|uniref:Anaphase-promoting complex subunit 7 n=1 Tax=Genlisea aurea TaxID=192259 RepID=S8DV35_9LAMI|nr:hypothetical protein M569_07749 [Genlisea aurea]
MDVPKEQISALLDHGLYSSAQILGCFAVSSTSANPETSPHLKAETLVQFGDSLFYQKEYGRAMHTYKQALEYHRIVSKQNAVASSITRNSYTTASNRSSSPNSLSTSAINENEVKFKIAKCHCAMEENRVALAQMESIPTKSRNLEMNMMMAKLYRISRHSRAAIGCLKECLRINPCIIEAIIGLADLGVPARDIISLFPQTPNRSGRPPSDGFDSSCWLQRYVEAQCCIASNDCKGGLELFSDLLQRFPNNIHLLLEIAKVKAIIGKTEEAILDFERVRSMDPYVFTYMDEYAMLLKVKPDQSKLNKLIHDLVKNDPSRPEVFVALSVFWQNKDDRGALSFAEKGIRTDERNALGHIMKGNLLMSMNRPEAAVVAYRGAQEIRPDLRSYQGLVRSYLALSKVKEALHASREAMKVMPHSAKALKLVGDVHASSAGGREKAKKFYESALRLEPGFLAAALALADLHVAEERSGDAVALLEKYLKDWADDSLHVKLAQIFAAMAMNNSMQEALSHYHAALRINPNNAAAAQGLDWLEKKLKGVDPDAAEEDEDEDNEVDEGEAEQEDAELL